MLPEDLMKLHWASDRGWCRTCRKFVTPWEHLIEQLNIAGYTIVKENN